MTLNLNVAPYFDDYDVNKGYLKILFKPGNSVQARELTQLQSLLQTTRRSTDLTQSVHTQSTV